METIEYEQSSNKVIVYSNDKDNNSSENKINVNLDNVLNENEIIINNTHPAIIVAQSFVDLNDKPNENFSYESDENSNNNIDDFA